MIEKIMRGKEMVTRTKGKAHSAGAIGQLEGCYAIGWSCCSYEVEEVRAKKSSGEGREE